MVFFSLLLGLIDKLGVIQLYSNSSLPKYFFLGLAIHRYTGLSAISCIHFYARYLYQSPS